MGCVSAKEKIQSRILTLKLKRACIEKERTENALALSGILGKRIYRQPVKRYVISKKGCVIEEENKNPRNPKRRRRSMDDFSDKEEVQDQQDLSLPLSKKKNYMKKNTLDYLDGMELNLLNYMKHKSKSKVLVSVKLFDKCLPHRISLVLLQNEKIRKIIFNGNNNEIAIKVIKTKEGYLVIICFLQS